MFRSLALFSELEKLWTCVGNTGLLVMRHWKARVVMSCLVLSSLCFLIYYSTISILRFSDALFAVCCFMLLYEVFGFDLIGVFVSLSCCCVMVLWSL